LTQRPGPLAGTQPGQARSHAYSFGAAALSPAQAARLDEPMRVVIGVKAKQLAAPNRDDTISTAACSLNSLFGRAAGPPGRVRQPV
jgi:hypothetical protein